MLSRRSFFGALIGCTGTATLPREAQAEDRSWYQVGDKWTQGKILDGLHHVFLPGESHPEHLFYKGRFYEVDGSPEPKDGAVPDGVWIGEGGGARQMWKKA